MTWQVVAVVFLLAAIGYALTADWIEQVKAEREDMSLVTRLETNDRVRRLRALREMDGSTGQ